MYRGRTATEVPETMEELKNFCYRHGLPLEQMRFFIGENYPGARAFGIYQDYDGYFVVYKNKADGTRAIRYRGIDEAYAVNEIYQKMKSEIQKQRAYRGNSTYFPGDARRNGSDQIYLSKPLVFGIAVLVFAIMMAVILSSYIRTVNTPSNGYYYYGDEYYYNQDDFWYVFDTMIQDWYPAPSDVIESIEDYHDSYWIGYEYNAGYDIDSFSESQFYSPDAYDGSWDDDWDDDWDWDSGSDWDSGVTDWDSDW